MRDESKVRFEIRKEEPEVRIVKYRAWAKNVGMYYSDEEGLAEFFRMCEDDILMQFTGIVDKYRKDIYECDIVLWGGKNWITSWSNLLMRYMLVTPESYKLGAGKYRGEIMHRWKQDKFKVLGNIFNGAKLMEVKSGT